VRGSSNGKQVAERIFRGTLAANDVRAALERHFTRHGSSVRAAARAIDLRKFKTIFAVAFGKAAFAMADGLVAALEPDFRVPGILVAPAAPPRALPGWEVFVGGHPVPTADSFAAGRAILEGLSLCGEETLVFFLLSGGGSSLVELPLDASVSLADFQHLHRLLVTCGAPIQSINAVRKHLSATKGGRLAAACPRALKITLGVSDVPAGEESALASGPTLPDPTTVADALRIVEEYRLSEKLPASLRALFERKALAETPKPGDPVFANAHFRLILGMHDLFHRAHYEAEAAGYVACCDNSTDNWSLDRAADFLLSQLAVMQLQYPGCPVAVIADGEVSSPVTGDGLGGRNSAFVLACVEKIAGRGITVLSGGTDGVDGNSPAAGAVADGETLARARAAGLAPADYFRRSDSSSVFNSLGDAIHTGPTGTNLRDLRILLAV
jgi:glycerate 2-kinase